MSSRSNSASRPRRVTGVDGDLGPKARPGPSRQPWQSSTTSTKSDKDKQRAAEAAQREAARREKIHGRTVPRSGGAAQAVAATGERFGAAKRTRAAVAGSSSQGRAGSLRNTPSPPRAHTPNGGYRAAAFDPRSAERAKAGTSPWSGSAVVAAAAAGAAGGGGGAAAPLELEDPMQLASAERIVGMLTEQLSAARAAADEAIDAVMRREEESVQLVAERRDRAADTCSRLRADAAAAAAEQEDLQEQIAHAKREHERLSAAIKEAEAEAANSRRRADVLEYRSSGGSNGANSDAATLGAPVWQQLEAMAGVRLAPPTTPGRSGGYQQRHEASATWTATPGVKHSHNTTLNGAGDRPAAAVAADLRSGIAALEAQLESRFSELRARQEELDEAMAERDSFTMSEAQAREELRRTAGSLRSGASTRLAMPLVQGAVADAEADLGRLQNDMKVIVDQLMDRATRDDAALASTARVADTAPHQRGSSSDAVMAISTALRTERRELDSLASDVVTEAEAADRTSDLVIAELRRRIESADSEVAGLKHRRSELCL